MKTEHFSIFSDSRQMNDLSGNSVDLIVTSPPYPMIEMWDGLFSQAGSSVKKRLKKEDGPGAFEAMHTILDAVWKEAWRVLKPGGFACINIGDATRTIDGNFALYPNHARILTAARQLGFSSLPCILWRKQTNAPNKFMGSGMLPAGAYVTLEHEYILVLRKGSKRAFTTNSEKENRRASALFWEERNLWFSDVWFDVKGTTQKIHDKETRKRSAAFPFELAYRLINMYSVKGDLVLDPFSGLGTTTAAAMASARNSVGYEIDDTLEETQHRTFDDIIPRSGRIIRQRLANHLDFVQQRMISKGPLKHTNAPYGFPVMTAQEKELLINEPVEFETPEKHFATVEYDAAAQKEFCKDGADIFEGKKTGTTAEIEAFKTALSGKETKQGRLF